ncbi:MAG: ABC transporter ATP-binding protein [Rhizobiaceae bacterium]|nr:ABC transporter ATP-binding protein [Rhizobiaceae bacterium]
MPLIEVKNLKVTFHGRTGPVLAVDDLSFQVSPGETLAIVGESGCGKSATAMSLLRLIQPPIGRSEGGSILFGGKDLLQLEYEEMRAVRGREIAMIFQEPMSSLNPVLTIGRQLTETVRVHADASQETSRLRAIELLHLVGLPDPESQLRKYPYELSGGMRQRVMIAMALINKPSLLIADEPTTALDVTIQAQVLDLLSKLQEETGTSILLITHDLGVVAEIAKRVIVMYAGRKVEEATTIELFDNPQHPYTRGLMAAGPRLGSAMADVKKARLREISGTVPIMNGELVGCPFAERCENVLDQCRLAFPQDTQVTETHCVACFNPNGAT